MSGTDRPRPEVHVISYEITRWFMERVAEQIELCRTAFEQGEPEAVE
ncbi:hypothetical protein [Streptomyces sp. ME19-01-6]|nr:hypothetical protein [Streptomyces sp. ME19-01-6]MDX3230447.1 hypothetical protein [Streptomyces sp. ME19-01-6]